MGNGSEYTIRISTPADFTGLDGIMPRMDQVAAAAAKTKQAVAEFNAELKTAATGKNFTQRLDEQIKAHIDAGVAAENAMRQRFDAQKTAPKWFDNFGPKESESSGGFTALATKLVPVAAAIKLVHDGLGEVAEDDRAEVALRRFGVAAEEAAKHAELIEKLDLFTGDKAAAAELFGRTMNGSTRGLVQFGIFLEETATKQERLNALQILAARGADAQMAKNQTLTGSFMILGKGLAEGTGDFLKWLGTVTGITSAVGWLNDQLGFTKVKADDATASVKDLSLTMAEMPQMAETARAAAEKTAAAFDDIRQRAEAATEKIDIMQGRLGKVEKAPTDEDIEDLELKRREASGEDPARIAKERSQLKFDRAEKQRQKDGNAAQQTKVEADMTLARLDEIEKKNRGGDVAKRVDELTGKARVASPERQAALVRLKEYEDKEEALKKEQQLWRGQPDTRDRSQALNRISADMAVNGRKVANAQQSVEGANLTQAEREELATLKKQQADERAAIDEQRRKAIAAKQSAETVERGLPNRKKAAGIQKQIDDEAANRLEGEREMKDAQTHEEMQSKVKERELDEINQQAEIKQRGKDTQKKIDEKLKEGGKKFLQEFGGEKNRNAKAALEEAKAATEKRLHGMEAKDAEEKTDEVFNEELRKQVHGPRGAEPYEAGAGGGKYRLRPRVFKSAADTQGSGLDQLNELQKKSGGPAPATPGAGGQQGGQANQQALQQAVKALQAAAAGMQSLGQLATVAQELQQKVETIKQKVDNLESGGSRE
jgi:hypothetical protein